MKRLFLIVILSLLFGNHALAAVDINTASQTELESLQGIGPAKAKAIIEYREKNGSFASIEDLAEVSGIGSGTIKQLGDTITVETGKNAQTPAAPVKQD